MLPTASKIFDFIESNPVCANIRHEVSSYPFTVLRHGLGSMVKRLYEMDDDLAHSHADALRTLLYELLTDPIPFDDNLAHSLHELGTAETVQLKWGDGFGRDFESAFHALGVLRKEENPLGTVVRERIQELVIAGASFKIFCHRKAALQFRRLINEGGRLVLDESTFLHTIKDYRETPPFEVLVKVGAFRAKGWGSVPDAIRSAPRFKAIEQIVWSGSFDERDFGYDPAAATASTPSPTEPALPAIAWETRTIQVSDGHDIQPSTIDLDEFQALGPRRPHVNLRRGVLVQITDAHGILYPPNAEVLSFDRTVTGPQALAFRLPGEDLIDGMHVVRPILGQVDLGSVQAEHGAYSAVWKARLNEAYSNSPIELLRKLRAAGLDLVHLGAAVANWCELGTTVIRAPQQRKHFEILIAVLGIEADHGSVSAGIALKWWQRAWNEVRRSRGEAIIAGMQEQQIIDEQLMVVLRNFLPEIQAVASQDSEFAFVIPTDQALQGAALFNRIRDVQTGFRAPENELKIVKDLYMIEQWRV